MPLDPTFSGLPKYLPTFLANYTKRLLERGYDRVFLTGFGRWLATLSPGKKYSLEAFLYALTAVLDDRLPVDSLMRSYTRQVGLDAAPEISKRMINGVRDEIAAMAATAKNPEEKELLTTILSLGDSDISNLLRWLSQTKVERDKILDQFLQLSEEQMAKFFRLSDEDKEKLIEFFRPAEKANQKSSEPSFGQVFRQDLVRGAERLRETKEKMRQQRKGGRR